MYGDHSREVAAAVAAIAIFKIEPSITFDFEQINASESTFQS